MSKKPILDLGKPKEDVIQRAAANDRSGSKLEPAKDKAEMKRLNVEIDKQLHGRFKQAVAGKNLSMTAEVTKMLNDWLAKNE